MSSKPELSGRALNRKVKRLAREYPEDMSPADRARRANRRARRRDFWSSRRLRARVESWRFSRRHRKHCRWTRPPRHVRAAAAAKNAWTGAGRRIRDYAHDAPWYVHRATLPIRNAAYRATRPIRSARGQYRNYRNRRFLQTGKGFWLERHTRGLRSSLPVYRDRINTATGRPRRDDAEIYGRRDMRLAHARQGGTFDPSRAWEHSPDAYRSAARERADGNTTCRDVPHWHTINDAGGRVLCTPDDVPARVRRSDPRARADAVLGPGTAARAQEAARQARHDPWAPRRTR